MDPPSAPAIATERLHECRTCHKQLPASSFQREAHNASGVRYHCKACRKSNDAKRAAAREVDALAGDHQAQCVCSGLVAHCALAGGGKNSVAVARAYLRGLMSAPEIKEGEGHADHKVACFRCHLNYPLAMFTFGSNRRSHLHCRQCVSILAEEKEASPTLWLLQEKKVIKGLLGFLDRVEPLKAPPSLLAGLPGSRAGPPLPGRPHGLTVDDVIAELDPVVVDEMLGWEPREASDAKRAAEVLSRLKRGNYVQVNLEPKVGQPAEAQPLTTLYAALRPTYDGLLREAIKEITDGVKLSLVLLGMKGTTTGWHRDNATADNICFRMCLPAPKTEASAVKSGKKRCFGALSSAAAALQQQVAPLALWAFIKLGREEEVERWQESSLGKPFADGEKFSIQEFEKMWRAMQELKDPPIFFLPQSHLTIIRVCPGIIHTVINLQPCVKLAWELYEPTALGLYSEAQMIGAGRYFGQSNAADYMHVAGVVVESCRRMMGI